MWTYGLKIDGEDQLNMYIHDWNIQKGEVITNAGTVYKYNLHDFREMNWTLDPSYIHYSLCTGFFIFDPQTRRAQIAVGHMGGEGNVDVGSSLVSKQQSATGGQGLVYGRDDAGQHGADSAGRRFL